MRSFRCAAPWFVCIIFATARPKTLGLTTELFTLVSWLNKMNYLCLSRCEYTVHFVGLHCRSSKEPDPYLLTNTFFSLCFWLRRIKNVNARSVETHCSISAAFISFVFCCHSLLYQIEVQRLVYVLTKHSVYGLSVNATQTACGIVLINIYRDLFFEVASLTTEKYNAAYTQHFYHSIWNKYFHKSKNWTIIWR